MTQLQEPEHYTPLSGRRFAQRRGYWRTATHSVAAGGRTRMKLAAAPTILPRATPAAQRALDARVDLL